MDGTTHVEAEPERVGAASPVMDRRWHLVGIAVLVVTGVTTVTGLLVAQQRQRPTRSDPYEDTLRRGMRAREARAIALASDALVPFGDEAAFDAWAEQASDVVRQSRGSEHYWAAFEHRDRRAWPWTLEARGVVPARRAIVHRDLLLALSGGVLYSVRLGAEPELASALDLRRTAHAPDALVAYEDTIVVLAPSSRASDRHAVGINLVFVDLDEHGGLSVRTRRQVGFDVDRASAQRIGDRLVITMESAVFGGPAGETAIPRLYSRWGTDLESALVSVAELPRPVQPSLAPVARWVLSCDIASGAPSCAARGVVASARAPYGHGNEGHLVTDEAAYFYALDEAWAQGPSDARHGVLYRVPHDGGAITGARLYGDGLRDVRRDPDGALWVTLVERRSHTSAVLLAHVRTLGPSAPPVADDEITELGASAGHAEAAIADEHAIWSSIRSDGAASIALTPLSGARSTALRLEHGAWHAVLLPNGMALASGDGGCVDLTFITLDGAPALSRSYRLRNDRSYRAAPRALARSETLLALALSPAPGDRLEDGAPNDGAEVHFYDLEGFAPRGSLRSNERHDPYSWSEPSAFFLEGRLYAFFERELVAGRIVRGEVRESSRLTLPTE
jgi:hypothetical protein